MLVLSQKSDLAAFTVYSQIDIDDREKRVIELIIKENYTILKDLF
jgi:hypothetical protein